MLKTNFTTFVIMLVFVGCSSSGNAGQNRVGTGKWELLSSSYITDSTSLRPIKFFDQKNGISLSVAIENTSDSGKTWKTVFYEENTAVAAGGFTSEQEGWVVGTEDLTRPLVMKTSDGGKSWSRIAFDNKSTEQLSGKVQVLWDICFDPNGRAWMLGETGILHVEMGEKDLHLLNLFSTNQENSDRISCNDSGDVWAIGRKGSIFHFHDGNWIKIKLDQGYSPSNVRSFGSDVWITGKNESGDGILLRSQDSGNTWQNKTPESAKNLNDLFLKDGKGWLIGSEGSIYYTTDNGESWHKSLSPTTADLLNIYSLDSNNVWISGDKATVLKYQN